MRPETDADVLEGHRITNPGPGAFQLPELVTVRILHRCPCAQSCARRGSIRPASDRRLKTEAPKWGVPRGPQEVSSGGRRLHEAERGDLTGRGSLDCRHRGDVWELTTIRFA